MANLRRFLATSDHPLARTARAVRRSMRSWCVPAPRLIVRPLVWAFVALRNVWYVLFNAFVCEPFFKAHCQSYGRGLKTGNFLHWVQGQGDIVIGDWVTLDGKISFNFASRFSERPRLEIGDHTYISHNVGFTVARSIRIGTHCLIAGGARIFDSSGHPMDPAKRLAGLPPDADDVQPIVIGNNVWIGAGAAILPGVTIGDGSVVGTNSVVTRDVPANTFVAGCPARFIRSLSPPAVEAIAPAAVAERSEAAT